MATIQDLVEAIKLQVVDGGGRYVEEPGTIAVRPKESETEVWFTVTVGDDGTSGEVEAPRGGSIVVVPDGSLVTKDMGAGAPERLETPWQAARRLFDHAGMG